MAFKPVGADENNKFPPRVEERLSEDFAALGTDGRIVPEQLPDLEITPPLVPDTSDPGTYLRPAGSSLVPAPGDDVGLFVTSVDPSGDAYKPVGVNAQGKFAPRVQNVLDSSYSSTTITAKASLFPGIDPTGGTDSRLALLAAVDATPDGGSLVIPSGTCRLYDTINIVDKNITLQCYGAKFVKYANKSAFSFSQTLGTTVSVSTVESDIFTTTSSDGTTVKTTPATKITLSDIAPLSWRRGEFVKIVADNYVTGTRTPTATTPDKSADGFIQARVGQIMEIKSVAGNVVVLDGKLRKTFDINVRAALIPSRSVRLYGGTFDVTDELIVTGKQIGRAHV